MNLQGLNFRRNENNEKWVVAGRF